MVSLKRKGSAGTARSSPCFSWTTPRDSFQSGLSSMKKTIPIDEITADLKNGTLDKELMKKYGLSEKGLKMVFDRLLMAWCNGARHIEVESEG